MAEIYAVLRTSFGDVEAELFSDVAPWAVQNFVGLAEGKQEWFDPYTSTNTISTEPLYNNTIFHRVIKGFMIQGGDPLGTGGGGPGYFFEDEISDLTFDRPHLLAMANSGPNTNGSQFFITVAPTPWLNGHHTIFGRVVSALGKSVVDSISRVPTDDNDRPLDDVVLHEVVIKRS